MLAAPKSQPSLGFESFLHLLSSRWGAGQGVCEEQGWWAKCPRRNSQNEATWPKAAAREIPQPREPAGAGVWRGTGKKPWKIPILGHWEVVDEEGTGTGQVPSFPQAPVRRKRDLQLMGEVWESPPSVGALRGFSSAGERQCLLPPRSQTHSLGCSLGSG